jgi:cyanophycinase
MTSDNTTKDEGSVSRQPGTLILIGGAEEKSGTRTILQQVVKHSAGGPLVVATLASEEPNTLWSIYSRIFQELGIRDVRHLAGLNREELSENNTGKILSDARAVFFTGGDQLKITTNLGGTTAYERIRNLYKRNGGLIAGTSAGAAAMGQVMLMSPEVLGGERHKVRRAFIMARGLGLTRDMVIDQHFAQRARIERLLGAIAEDPGLLGVGLDEDTAIVVRGSRFDVIGSGAVYVADGSSISYTNVNEQSYDRTLCLFNVRLHVLSTGSGFEIASRTPIGRSAGDE